MKKTLKQSTKWARVLKQHMGGEFSQDKVDKLTSEAYYELSQSSGFPLTELVGRGLALIKDGKSKYFGQIGLVDSIDSSNVVSGVEKYVIQFRASESKRRVRKEFVNKYRENDKVFSASNIFYVLGERDKLGLLFPEMYD